MEIYWQPTAEERRLAFIRDNFKDSIVEDTGTEGAFRIDGEIVWIPDPKRGLSFTQELIAELSGAGMSPTKIARMFNYTSPGTPMHYKYTLRDPRLKARKEKARAEILREAKEKLHGSVLTAADNVVDAVNKGDYKASLFVLGTQGITDKPQPQHTTNNLRMDFGSWLSEAANTKQMHEIPQQAIEAEVEEN